MPEYVADKRLYHDASRSRVVEDGPEAAFLLVGEGGVLPEAEVERLGLKDYMREVQHRDAVEVAKEEIDQAVERGALEQAAAMRIAVERLEGERAADDEARAAREATRLRVEAKPDEGSSAAPDAGGADEVPVRQKSTDAGGADDTKPARSKAKG